MNERISIVSDRLMSSLPIVDLLGKPCLAEIILIFARLVLAPSTSLPSSDRASDRLRDRRSNFRNGRFFGCLSSRLRRPQPVRPSTSAPLSAITNGGRGGRPLISQIRLPPLPSQSHTWGLNLSPSFPLPHVSFGLPPPIK